MNALSHILMCDKLIKISLDTLKGIRRDIGFDLRELSLLYGDLENGNPYKGFCKSVREKFLKSLERVIEETYEDYSLFNFDLLLVVETPHQIREEICRMDPIGRLNRRLEGLLRDLDEVLKGFEEELTLPLKTYRELIGNLIELNNRMWSKI